MKCRLKLIQKYLHVFSMNATRQELADWVNQF